MSTQDNIERTKQAYAAFSNADVEGASRDMSDDIEWTVSGNSKISGTYRGKDEVLGFWMELAGKSFRTAPHRFLGDGDTVVVLTTTHVEGESAEQADVLTFADGKLVAFRSIGDTALAERIWGAR
jgi:ketosteroid isomerase-like protein